jgi:hypothetical protein
MLQVNKAWLKPQVTVVPGVIGRPSQLEIAISGKIKSRNTEIL